MANKNSLLSKLFKPKVKKKTFDETITMVGYEPSFSSFGKTVLYSDIILCAERLKARFFGKLEPRHVRKTDGITTVINDSSIAKVLRNPNKYQNLYDFLTQAWFMRAKDNNCYIFADYYNTVGGSKVFTGLYILLPSEKPQVKEDENGNLYYSFRFDGYSDEVVFNFDEIICWKQNYEDNQYSGGGKFSNNANADLLSSLEAYHTSKEAVAEAAKIGCYIDGIIKVNSYAADAEKTQTIRNKFIEDLQSNKSGIGVLDNGADYIAIQRQLKMVDSETLKEIKENILIHTGVTDEMLKGKFTTQDKEALYENWIEPAAISLGQAMSKVFFSDWQITHGDDIILYPNKVQLMATSEIISIIQSTVNAGIFKIDEFRDMLGYAPLENGEGQQRPRGFNNLDGSDTDTGGGADE